MFSFRETSKLAAAGAIAALLVASTPVRAEKSRLNEFGACWSERADPRDDWQQAVDRLLFAGQWPVLDQRRGVRRGTLRSAVFIRARTPQPLAGPNRFTCRKPEVHRS